MTADTRKTPPTSFSLRTLRAFLLLAVAIVTYAGLVLPLSLRPAMPPLEAGDVSPLDIQAPRNLEYVSEVRTEDARQRAEKAVQPVYTAPDQTIARQQIASLRSVFATISAIRADTTSTTEAKAAQIAAVSRANLKTEDARAILDMSDSRWTSIQQDAVRVLEQVMRTSVRADNADLVASDIPNRVSLTLNEQDAALVTVFVKAFVVPNSQYSQELTTAAQQAARDAVQPVVESYKAGETIVAGGAIITVADMEALQEFGLIQSGQPVETLLSAGALTLSCALLVALYYHRHPRLSFLVHARSLIILAFIFLIFVLTARLVVPNRTIVPYAFPLPAAGLLIASLFGMETGLLLSIPICILATYGQSNTLVLMPYYLLATLCGTAMLGQARRFWAFIRAGVTIAVVGGAMILAYRLSSGPPIDWLGLATLAGAAAFNGLASAGLALLLQYLLAQFLSLPTALQLLEISRPDFPLLQEFLRKAPGTYQHSLHVANLAEQAADYIGADTLLTRVGAIYHDIGKTASDPSFFIENQATGNLDTHGDLSPDKAAKSIIDHVRAGVALAHKYRLPQRIDDFILEHHGTMVARYQYNQALEAAAGDASKVDIEKFRYPGPRPRSRETALLMLSDAVEARSRAEAPESEEQLKGIVRSVIDRVEKERQLDDTQLTLHDLNLITESFVKTLRGTYHPRIQYPAGEVPASAAAPTAHPGDK
ncbi:MAG: HD family phosphohydrolase [Anaerolineales bacterium]